MAIEQYLTQEQEKEISKLPPEVITPLISPSGEETYALPQHLDALVREGYTPKYSNQTFRVGQGDWGETQDIKALELPDYISRGYKLRNPSERYYEKKGEYLTALDSAERTTDPYAKVAGISGALASGITWGASDIALRGAFEGLDALGLAGEGGAEGLASTQLKARDDLGGWGTAIEMAGGLGTGGTISSLGKTGLARVGLGAAEGALAGTTFTAGRQALGDDNIDVESYMWAAGLGTVLGAAGEGVAQGLGKYTRVTQDTLPELKLDDNLLNSIRSVNQGVEHMESIPIISAQNDIVGFAEVAVNSQGAYHPIAKTGLSIENITFSNGVTPAKQKAYTQSFINKMVEEFGAVASPSKLDNLTGDLKEAFSKFGIRRETMDADPFFVVTEATAPSPRKIWLGRYAKYILEKTGKAPEPGSREGRLFDKLFDDDTGMFTREFLDYFNDYDKYLNAATKDVREVAGAINTSQKVAQDVREQVVKSFDPAKLPELKVKTLSLIDDLKARVQDIRSYNSRDLDNVAGALEKHINTLDGVVKSQDPVSAYRAFYNSKQDVFNLVSTLSKKQEAGKYLSATSRNALKGVVDNYNQVLKSADLIGEEAAEIFQRLDLYSSKMIKSTDTFKRIFKVDNPTQFQRSVKQAFRPREGGIQGSQGVVDVVSSDYKAFVDVLNEAKSKGFLTDIAVPESASTRKALNNIGKLREFQELTMLMRKMKGDNATTGLMSSGGASTGSVFGSTLLGGTLGPLGGAIGALIGSGGIKKMIDPMELLASSVSQDKKLLKFRQFIEKSVDQLNKNNVMNKQALRATIGITSNNMKTPTSYAKSVEQRIYEMKQASESIYGSVGDQLVEDALKKKTDKMLDYVAENIPKRPKGVNLNSTDSRTLDKLLLAAFKPQEAFRIAFDTGDNEILKHLQVLYPNMVQMSQQIVSESAEEGSKSYRRFVSNTLRKSAVSNAQSVFAKKEDKGISTKGMTIPSAPMGVAIQD